MKKSLMSLIAAAMVITSVATITVFAADTNKSTRASNGVYTSEESIYAVTDNPNQRIVASGRATAYAQGRYLEMLRVTLYVTRSDTGSVVINRTAYAPENSNTVYNGWSVGASPQFPYTNEVVGICIAKDNPEAGTASRKVYYTPSRSANAVDTVALEESFKTQRDNMLLSFGENPNDYSYYLDGDIVEVSSVVDCCFFRDQMELVEGDSTPGFYMNDVGDSLVAVKKDSDDNLYKYVFEKNETDDWALVDVATK